MSSSSSDQVVSTVLWSIVPVMFIVVIIIIVTIILCYFARQFIQQRNDYLLNEERCTEGIPESSVSVVSMALTRRICRSTNLSDDTNNMYYTEAFIHFSLRKVYLLFMAVEKLLVFNDDVYIEIIRKMVDIDFDRFQFNRESSFDVNRLQFMDREDFPIKKVIQVAQSENHTILLTMDGKLYGKGNNDKGQLGIGTFYDHFHGEEEDDEELFTCLTHDMDNRILPKAYQVYCNGDSTMMITEEGLLYACGDNQYGKLGFNDCQNRARFQRVFHDNEGNKIPPIRMIECITECKSFVICESGNRLGISSI